MQLKKEKTERQLKEEMEWTAKRGLATPDWRVRAGPRNRPTQKEREEHEATHVPF